MGKGCRRGTPTQVHVRKVKHLDALSARFGSFGIRWLGLGESHVERGRDVGLGAEARAES